MSNTINNGIPFVPENTIDPAAGLNLALNTIDALLQLLVITVGANTPPTGVEGNRYIVGTSPTGAWSGQANKLARFLDGAWHFYSARYALNVADGLWYVRSASTWAPLAGGGGGEANTASNLGAGQGVFASKVGVDLRFKSLVAGTNVSLSADGNTITINASGGGGSGAVTSVGLSAPTGFDVSGSPVTASGTLALSFSTGYSLPTNTNQSNWSTAFGWGNHASAGYEKELTAGANITIDRTDPDNPVISASASSGMTNPMTTLGDLIKGGASGTPSRLGVGSPGQLLGVASGEPAWVNAPSGRNALINGNFLINQEAVTGTVTLAAGAYGHDMWKAGSSGCTYTFAKSAGVTTLTITAGSLQQIIEGDSLATQTYCLSWTGTAQGKIGAGSYSASGVTGAVTGGSNLTVEFNTGTLAKVQLEAGSAPTPFELRSFAEEIADCQRYFWTTYAYGTAKGTATFDGAAVATAVTTSVASAQIRQAYPVQMRATPTITYYNPNSGAAGTWRVGSGSDVALSAAGIPASDKSVFIANATGIGAGVAMFGHIVASARL